MVTSDLGAFPVFNATDVSELFTKPGLLSTNPNMLFT